MAEGGIPPKGGGFLIEKAWDHLFFETKDKETTYKKDAFDSIEPCKLQFVLKSDIASQKFYSRIGKPHIFKILSHGHVGVEVDSSELTDIDRFWVSLIESVSQALQDEVVRSLTLSSEEQLETALQNLDGCCQNLILSGYVDVFYTNVKDSFVLNFVGSDSATATVYEDVSATAMKNKLRKELHFSHREIKAIVELGVINELEEGFKDLVIQVYIEEAVVRLHGYNMRLIDDCVRELRVLTGRMQIIALDFLSESAQKLLKNEKVRKYIQEVLKDEKITFVTDDQDLYLVVRKIKSIPALKVSVQNCFGEMKIDKDFLQTAQWKCFLEEQCDKIIRKDYRGISNICFTLDLKEEVESLLSSFKKPCFRVVRDFLQLFSSNILKSLADKHHVRAEINQNYVCFQGQYHNGQEAMDELERLVKISVVNFNYDKSTVRLLSSQKQLDDISQCYKCSINVAKFSQGQHTLENNSTDGIEYLAKWRLHGNKGQISVTEVDFEKANLDGLIIPVNECMFGEDIFGEELDERPYIVFCGSQCQKLEVGQWRPLEFSNRYRGTNCVALVTFGIVIVDNKQSHCTVGSKLGESVKEIIHDMLSKGQWTIRFAVPSNNPDFKSKLNDILSAYQDVVDEFGGTDISELVLCVKQSAEWWLQEVDYCLRWTVCTRRQVGLRYYGLFDKPHVNIEITRKSLLEVETSCLVVAISPNLDLSKGHVSKLISEACGEKLQQELQSKHQKIASWGVPFAVDSYNLSRKGVKKLMFGSLPFWSRNKNLDLILENFVQESLLLADSYGCSSVALPVLGTGNLAFPLRDAVVALMDGIERYIAETTVGNISTVYIAVHDDTTAEILDLAQRRRKANSEIDGKHSKIKDHTYLFAEDENVKCYIANETVFRTMSSGRHIEVFFTPVPGKHLDVQTDLKDLERMMVTCGNSTKGLQSAIRKVVNICEKERITSVAVHCCRNFSFSETDQVDVILHAALHTIFEFDVNEYPVWGRYKYLKHVTMVTSDAGFSVLNKLKLPEDKQSKPSSSFFHSLATRFTTSSSKPEMKWRRICITVPETFINVILAGDVESDQKKALQDIEKLCTTTNSSSDLAEFTNEVTAELNLGIVKYLKNLPDLEFNRWKHDLNIAYGVVLRESEGCSKLLITGHFDDILKTEYYLENEFPSLPTDVNLKIEKQNQMYDDKQLVQFTIPVNDKDKIKVIRFFYKELQALLAEKHVEEYSTSADGLSIKCLLSVKEDVESGVKQLISNVNDLDSITVLLSPCELDTLLQREKSDNIYYEVNESPYSVQLIGRTRDLVYQEAENIYLEVQKRRNKRHDPFLYKRAKLKFRNLDVVVSHEDITDSRADCIVSPVNELMNQNFGVAKEIAKKAGVQYTKECQTVLKQIQQIDLTQCVDTGSGNLKTKYVLHVHSPTKFGQHVSSEQLSQITDSIRHCLEKAEQLEAASVAFPFVCAGLSDIPVELCAQQYFRALEYLKPQEHLKEVKFVDIKEESVSRVCQTLTECMKTDDMDIRQTYSEIIVNDINIFIQKGHIHAVMCDVIVLNVDESLRDNDGELNDILKLTNQRFQKVYDDEKKRKHSCTSVLSLKSGDGELTNKFVLFAVTPVWKSNQNKYAESIRNTTRHILEKMCELRQSDLALPVLCNSEDSEVLVCCCQAMTESVLDFIKGKKNKIKSIHFLIKKEKTVSAMCRAMAVGLKSVSGCAGSVEV